MRLPKLPRWLIPSLAASALAATFAWAASSTLSNLSSASSVNGTDNFYDVQTPGTGGVKATAAQIGAYIFGLVSGGCTSTTGGAFTCTQPTGANPSGTAGPSAVNGSASTFMRSDAAPAVQKSSSSQFGIVETDGSTIGNASGVISCTTATTSQLGCVKPDGTIITDSAGVITVPKASSSVFGVAEVDGTTITASGGVISAAGGGGNTITLTADTNIAAGTAVAINSSGHAVQTWGPAPNIAGVVTILSEIGINNNNNYTGVTALSSTQFIAWSYSTNQIVSVSVSGTTVTVGTPVTISEQPIAILALSSTTFVVVSGTTAYAGTVSSGTITLGSSVSFSDITSFAALSTTAFVLTSSGGTSVIGTVASNVITLGTPTTIGSGSFDFNTATVALSSTSFVVLFNDDNNNGYLTAVVCTATGLVITQGTPVAYSLFANGTLTAAYLSSSTLVVGFSYQYEFYGIVVSVSGTTPTFGTAVVVSPYTQYSNTPTFTGLHENPLAVIDSTHVAFAAGNVLPQIYTISGTALSGSVLPLPNLTVGVTSSPPVKFCSDNKFCCSCWYKYNGCRRVL